jgi:hypothetical protein
MYKDTCRDLDSDLQSPKIGLTPTLNETPKPALDKH